MQEFSLRGEKTGVYRFSGREFAHIVSHDVWQNCMTIGAFQMDKPAVLQLCEKGALCHDAPMKILFITSSRIGDAVLSTGLLNYMAQKWPDAKVTIACGALAASLFEGYPNLERLIPMKK